ncbi:MAG: DUF1566 domain-containing protein [Candidatus Schekmanbacteria bacterium]|nr:DUF1566 domain-containing protein [Candidatus Schekmanbacteria bacterium]
MCKLKSDLFFFAAVVFLLVPFILQAAGKIELPRTGQTISYATGDDGNIQAGVAWPNPRFTDNDDETVTDNLTGLMWTKDGNLPNGYKTWQEALDYIASLNNSNYLGFNDWRLPNVNELKSLLNADEPDSSIWLNTLGFNNVQASNYWSSSTYTSYTSYAWCVDMDLGVYVNGKTYDYYVWPVRSGQSGLFGSSVISLPQTGQSKCYETFGAEIACTGTGQDGDIQAGVAWPNPRFTDNVDETVTDNLTGLMWTKDGNLPNGYKKWQEALDYIASLNSSNYLGFNDWRLPNANELKSIANADEPDSTTWLNTQGFNNVQASSYWSSSTWASYTYFAWRVDLRGGVVWDGNKGGYNYVWPVRSVQSGLFVPSVISCSPKSGMQGKKLKVTISGEHFDGAGAVSFGSGITVITFTVVSNTQIIANIKINSSATAGEKNVSVTTPNGKEGMSRAFSVGNLPDLKVNSVTFPNKISNNELAIAAMIENVGKRKTHGSSAKFYLSTNNDSTKTDADIPLWTEHVRRLKKNQKRFVVYVWDVDAVSGTYYIKVVCDSGNTIIESNENNNIKASKKIIIK